MFSSMQDFIFQIFRRVKSARILAGNEKNKVYKETIVGSEGKAMEETIIDGLPWLYVTTKIVSNKMKA